MSRRFEPRLAGLLMSTLLGAAGLLATPAMAGGDMEMPAPKRVGPKAVAPVTVGELRIEAVHWGRARGLGQNGGYIEAFEAATGKPAWLLQVYKIDYEPKLEEDVQDRFIRQLALACKDRILLVTDERGRCFEVELATRQVTPTGPHCAPTAPKP